MLSERGSPGGGASFACATLTKDMLFYFQGGQEASGFVANVTSIMAWINSDVNTGVSEVEGG